MIRPISAAFESFLKQESEQKPLVKSLQEKVLEPHVKMKEKAAQRNMNKKSGTLKWSPQVRQYISRQESRSITRRRRYYEEIE